MKFTEAMEMIRDGGRARVSGWINTEFYVHFVDDFLQVEVDSHSDEEFFQLETDDLFSDEWIVEKEGILYYLWAPKYMRNKASIEAMNRRRADHELELVAKILEDNTLLKADDVIVPPIPPMFMSINEDWLSDFVERKMICYVSRREKMWGSNISLKELKCTNIECKFCHKKESDNE
jgi:hypothetical protein